MGGGKFGDVVDASVAQKRLTQEQLIGYCLPKTAIGGLPRALRWLLGMIKGAKPPFARQFICVSYGRAKINFQSLARRKQCFHNPGDDHGTKNTRAQPANNVACGTEHLCADSAVRNRPGSSECGRSSVDSSPQGHGRVLADTEAILGVLRTDWRARSGRWPKAAAYGNGRYG